MDLSSFDPSFLEQLKKIRPLVFCLSHSWGGLEQVAASDSSDLATLGVPVRVVCLKGSPIEKNLANDSRVELFALEAKPRNYFDLELKKEIESHLKSGVNLVHSHQTSILGSIVPWIYLRGGVSAFATRHIMNNHDKHDWIHRAIYRRLDALIVMSQTLRENVLQTHAIEDARVKVIHLGLDFERFDPDKVQTKHQRALWGADDQTTVIGLVGRIDPAKGQSTFIKAAAGLLKGKRRDEKIKFVIVGEETLGSAGAFLGELKQMVSQFHLDESVVFAGFQENIPEVMAAFDIFVMPSRQEAFGLVAIEAMAMECPIIISSGGSAQEIVGLGSEGQEAFGLTVRPDDAFDLQRQLSFLLENPKSRVEMGKRGRTHVMRNYDRRLRLKQTVELYLGALHSRQPRETFSR
jgi:glycosyltransferase involved in cell wall biosynthesis